MPNASSHKFRETQKRYMLLRMHESLLDPHIDLIDDGRDDFRDQIGDLISLPDPNEPSDFAPISSRERF